jgi:hypothetical protein
LQRRMGRSSYGQRVGDTPVREVSRVCDGADGRGSGIAAVIQAAGKTSLRAIAAGLNELGIPTARGGEWSSPHVMRMLERLDPFRPEEEAQAA